MERTQVRTGAWRADARLLKEMVDRRSPKWRRAGPRQSCVRPNLTKAGVGATWTSLPTTRVTEAVGDRQVHRLLHDHRTASRQCQRIACIPILARTQSHHR